MPARTSMRGFQSALRFLLVHPRFLFRIEQDPDKIAPGTNYRITDSSWRHASCLHLE